MSVLDEAKITMTDDHNLVVGVPADTERLIEHLVRHSLSKAVAHRWSEPDKAFLYRCRHGALEYFEDDEHGLLFGVVLRAAPVTT